MKKKIITALVFFCALAGIAYATNTTHYNYALPTVGASQGTWGSMLNTIVTSIDANIWSASQGTTIGVNAPSASGSNITLTNPVNNIQNIAFSATGKALILPPENVASSLVIGGTMVVNNVGSNAFEIFAQDGTTVIVPSLPAGGTAYLTLLTNGTLNGTFETLLPASANNGAISAPGYIVVGTSAASGDELYSTAANSLTLATNSTAAVTIDSSQRLGVGTLVPDSLLSLDGQAARTIDMVRETTSATAGNNLTLQAGGAILAGTNLNGGNLILSSGVSVGTGRSDIRFFTFPAGTTGTSDNTATQQMVLTSAGSLGIGTAAPVSPFQVIGASTLSGATTVSGTLTVSGTATLSAGGTSTTPSANDSSTNIATTAFVNPASALNQNGYQTFPSGLILEWGLTGSIVAGACSTISIPLGFPNNFFSVTAVSNTPDSVATSNNYAQIASNSTFSMCNKQSGTATFTWMATGH